MTLDVIGATDLARWVSVLGPARQLAEVLADTDFVPRNMRGKPDEVTAAIMYGDELGLGPMQALAGIDVVEGKPRPSAELARALILRAGHTFVMHEASGTRVRVSGLRHGAPEAERVTVDWTLDMARSAGLVNGVNWRKYPRAMLIARATSDLSRILFPDVIKGLGYIAETATSAAELEEWAGPEELPPVAPPTLPAIQRRVPPRPRSHPEVPPVEPVPAVDADPPTSPHGPPVDLPPETDPGAESNPEERPVADAWRRALFGAIGRTLGPGAGRTERLALCSAILGRDVATSNDLNRLEVSRIITWLEDPDTAWNWDAEHERGAIVRRSREPPTAVEDVPLPDPEGLDAWVAHEGEGGDDPWQ